MFNDNVQQRLALFELGPEKKVEYSNEVLHLTEKGAGQADVTTGDVPFAPPSAHCHEESPLAWWGRCQEQIPVC